MQGYKLYLVTVMKAMLSSYMVVGIIFLDITRYLEMTESKRKRHVIPFTFCLGKGLVKENIAGFFVF